MAEQGLTLSKNLHEARVFCLCLATPAYSLFPIPYSYPRMGPRIREGDKELWDHSSSISVLTSSLLSSASAEDGNQLSRERNRAAVRVVDNSGLIDIAITGGIDVVIDPPPCVLRKFKIVLGELEGPNE
jgi:hypothetical protein